MDNLAFFAFAAGILGIVTSCSHCSVCIADMTHTSDSEHDLVAPGDLLANIPGILGYYPHHSFIAFVFYRDYDDHSDATKYLLGPVMRADLDDREQLTAVITHANHLDAELVLCAMISDRLDIEAAKDLAAELAGVAQEAKLPFDAVWFANELSFGAEYVLVHGASKEHLRETTTGWETWDSGFVTEVMATASAEHFRRLGELPELSRTDSVEYVAGPNPYLDGVTPQEITTAAELFSREVLAALLSAEFDEADHVVDSLFFMWSELLEGVTLHNAQLADLMANEDIIHAAAPYFVHTYLRDSTLMWADTEHVASFFKLSLAVARSTTGNVRANALCCAALCAGGAGVPYRITQALHAALDAKPGHRLAELLSQALTTGAFEVIASATTDASRQAAAMLRSGNFTIAV